MQALRLHAQTSIAEVLASPPSIIISLFLRHLAGLLGKIRI